MPDPTDPPDPTVVPVAAEPRPVPTREQLLDRLQEAAEIEHVLMCSYLYAAFSLKPDDPAWTGAQRDAVARWRREVTAVALEEMGHLALVLNLATAIGGLPPLGRPPFPIEAGHYPAGVVIRLAPFCEDTVAHFRYLERPPDSPLAPAPGHEPTVDYVRHRPDDALSPGACDYATVGGLYEHLAQSLQAHAAAHGEAVLFTGPRERQVDGTLVPLPGIVPVTDLASALTAIQTVVTQGEGAGPENPDSHYHRFGRVLDELRAARRDDPGFEPAWPAAVHPVMNPPVTDADDRVHVDHPVAAAWLDLGDALYTTAVRCLLQGFVDTDAGAKAAWLGASFGLMQAMVPIGQGLAAHPARADAPLPHAGLGFTPLRSPAAMPSDQAPRLLAERLADLIARAGTLPPPPCGATADDRWQRLKDGLVATRRTIAAIGGPAAEGDSAAQAGPGGVGRGPADASRDDDGSDGDGDAGASTRATGAEDEPVAATVAAEAEAAAQTRAPAAAVACGETTPAVDPVEVVRGLRVTVRFEGRRCIHARHCVLDAPTVFEANTVGDWIHPDAAPVEVLLGVEHDCPSGAIRLERHDGGPTERPPAVNRLRLRENGPYAVHAPLVVAGADDGLRATLCRCGASHRKPWCDGSHGEAGFRATGEPPGPPGDLPIPGERAGPLIVEPLRDGPLWVRGPLEICSGTGRPLARVSDVRLCRCGLSRNKPYCDSTHLGAGFVADGQAGGPQVA